MLPTPLVACSRLLDASDHVRLHTPAPRPCSGRVVAHACSRLRNCPLSCPTAGTPLLLTAVAAPCRVHRICHPRTPRAPLPASLGSRPYHAQPPHPSPLPSSCIVARSCRYPQLAQLQRRAASHARLPQDTPGRGRAPACACFCFAAARDAISRRYFCYHSYCCRSHIADALAVAALLLLVAPASRPCCCCVLLLPCCCCCPWMWPPMVRRAKPQLEPAVSLPMRPTHLV